MFLLSNISGVMHFPNQTVGSCYSSMCLELTVRPYIGRLLMNNINVEFASGGVYLQSEK